MGSRVERSIRHFANPLAVHWRNVPAGDVSGSDRRAALDAWQGRSPIVPGLTATIVAVLDRDNKLRHDYLLKRWQGVIA